MKYIFIHIITLLSTSAFSQPDSLVLKDTIETIPLEVVISDDLILFHETFDTILSDGKLTIYEHNDSWAGKSLIHLNSNSEIEHALLIDPDVNTSVDSVAYVDINIDGTSEAIFYCSRTNGSSGQSGGFSDYADRIIVVDLTEMTILFDFEYYTHYENWDQDYNEETDEYISIRSECHGYSGQLYVCEGRFLFLEESQQCMEPNNIKTKLICFYYVWDGQNMVRNPYSIYDGPVCD